MSVLRGWGRSSTHNRHWWLWVPAFAGTTEVGVVSNRKSQSSQLPRIGKCKRRHPPGVFVEDQSAGDRRLGALAAIFALAEPTVDADRRALGLIEIDPGGVDQAGGMADFPTEPRGERRLRLPGSSRPPVAPPGHRDIPA